MTSGALATLSLADAAVRHPADQRAYRLSAIDMGGLAIVIMAIDRPGFHHDRDRAGPDDEPEHLIAAPSVQHFVSSWSVHA